MTSTTSSRQERKEAQEMDLNGVSKLLSRISVNYPQFKKQISDGKGMIQRSVAEEWERQIGFLTLEEAMQRFDLYMETEETTRPPKPSDLKRYKPRQKSEEWHAPISHRWHLEFPRWDQYNRHGRLFDQGGREYVHDPVYEDGYHYDQQGRICTIRGEVV